MFVSAEVRWFWKDAAPPPLDEWFHGGAYRPGGGTPRTDDYLLDSGQRELGVKRRGGSDGIELKFFAILLPGSLATWLAVQYVPLGVLKRALGFGLGASEPDALVLGTAFLVSSYTLGHFVFMAGSQLDGSYDRWRQRVKPTLIATRHSRPRNNCRSRSTTAWWAETSRP